jgi:mannosyltransferase OCH1-like enzyme
MKVPKLFHFVWLGEHDMHPLLQKWVAGWGSLHPDWVVRVWRDGTGLRHLVSGDLVLESRYPALLDAACHLSQRSNIWRYEIVLKYGGVYVDTDTAPILNIVPLVSDKAAFSSCYLKDQAQYGCSFFGAVKQHPWTRDLVENLESADPAVSGSMGVQYFTTITKRHPEVAILPAMAVLHDYNPWFILPGNLPNEEHIRSRLGPDTYAVHHWSSLWFPKGFEKISLKGSKP